VVTEPPVDQWGQRCTAENTAAQLAQYDFIVALLKGREAAGGKAM